MKNTIVKMDDLGRITIPKEFCNNLHIKNNDLLNLCLNSNEKEVYISIKKNK